MSGHDITGFIDDVQLHAMANNGAGYLAFGQIAVGIEFLGACRDSKDFATAGESKTRFNKGISHYMAKVDTRYATYNTKESPYNLYRHLRCGMAHLIRPQGEIGLIGKGNADAAGLQHLEKHPEHDAIMLVLEPFLADFVSACTLLKSDLPSFRHKKNRASLSSCKLIRGKKIAGSTGVSLSSGR